MEGEKLVDIVQAVIMIIVIVIMGGMCCDWVFSGSINPIMKTTTSSKPDGDLTLSYLLEKVPDRTYPDHSYTCPACDHNDICSGEVVHIYGRTKCANCGHMIYFGET